VGWWGLSEHSLRRPGEETLTIPVYAHVIAELAEEDNTGPDQ